MTQQCIPDIIDFWILGFFIKTSNESTISSKISITVLVEFPWLNHQVALAFRIFSIDHWHSLNFLVEQDLRISCIECLLWDCFQAIPEVSLFKMFSNKAAQFFIVVSGRLVFLCHRKNTFCQLFNDPSILQAFCFVLIFITFSDLSPYSSFSISFPFLNHLCVVRVLFTSSRVFVMLAR